MVEGLEVAETSLVAQEAQTRDLSVTRDPVKVLEDARKAAEALVSVLSTKKKKVMFNGEQYLEFEDWATVARFYNVTAKVVSTEHVVFGNVQGFLSRAVAYHGLTGQEISCAEAMCLNDEDNWSTRAKYEWINGKKEKVKDVPVPLFQLRSMSQTRSCAKVLRIVFSWIVVLAGFRPTPAEEMTSDLQRTDSTPTPKATSNGGNRIDVLGKLVADIAKEYKTSASDIIYDATMWNDKKTGKENGFRSLSVLKREWQIDNAIANLLKMYPDMMKEDDPPVKMPEKKEPASTKTQEPPLKGNLISPVQFSEWQSIAKLSTHSDLEVANKLMKTIKSTNPKLITREAYLELIEWLQG